jgi:hypothetical protein
MGTNNTPLITWTKIIQPMVFIVFPNEGVLFIVGFVMAMHYPLKFQKICYGAQLMYF